MLYIIILCVVSVYATSISTSKTMLNKINGLSTTLPTGTPEKVGGFSRLPGVLYDNEVVLTPDFSSVSSVQTAKLRVYINGGFTFGIKTLNLVAQDQGGLSANLTYDSFCSSASDCSPWGSVLATASVDATTPEWVELQSPALTTKIKEYIENSSNNTGFVLTGDFGNWDYNVLIGDVVFVLDEGGAEAGTSEPNEPETENPIEYTHTLDGEHWALKQELWVGNTHQKGGTVKVGGYTRYQPYGFEALTHFAIDNVSDKVTHAKLRFHVTGGSSILPASVYLFNQNKVSNWNENTVTYDTFGSTGWNMPLGVAKVDVTQPGWYEIEGSALTQLVQSWQGDLPSNQGLILAGAFWHWGYYANVDDFELLLATSKNGVVGEYIESAHQRNYNFSFREGNLAANWSFETQGASWTASHPNGIYVSSDARYKQIEKNKNIAVSGSYVGTASQQTGDNPENEPAYSLLSDLIPLKSGETYTLSFYYRGTSDIPVTPVLSFRKGRSEQLEWSPSSAALSSTSSWQLYRRTFTVPSIVDGVILILYHTLIDGNADYYFDDVVLEKGSKASSRGGISESVSFSDGLGRLHQRHIMSDRENYGVSAINSCLDQHVLYAKNNLTMKRRSVVTGGQFVGQNSFVAEDEAYIVGNLKSNGSVTLANRVKMVGDVLAPQTPSMGTEFDHEGNITTKSWETCSFPPLSTITGSENITINNGEQHSLVPGQYGALNISAGVHVSRLYLSTGSYHFHSFAAHGDMEILFDVSEGPIEIFVENDLSFHDRTTMIIPDHFGASKVIWKTKQTSSVLIGADSRIIGSLLAPNASVVLGNRTVFEGGIYASSISIGEDAFVGLNNVLFDGNSHHYLVEAFEFDVFGRTKKSSLPFGMHLSGNGYVLEGIKNANAFYLEANDQPDAEGYAYSEVSFVDESTNNDEQVFGAPGAKYIIGAHDQKSGTGCVNSLLVESSFPIPSFENEEDKSCDYTLAWTKNAEGQYNLSWKNLRGELVQTAAGKTAGVTPLGWSIRQYDYHPNGKLRQVKTPLDVQSGTEQFSEYKTYLSDGTLESSFDVTRGLVQYWYSFSGLLRFRQDAGQREEGIFTSYDYDNRARLIAEYEVGGFFPNAKTDQLRTYENSSSGFDLSIKNRVEHLYSSVSRFNILYPNLTLPFVLENTTSQLVASFRTNLDGDIPLSEERTLVADFYSYDIEGKVKARYKYIGAIENATDRWQKIEYLYNDFDELEIEKVYANASSDVVVSSRAFLFDEKGRARQIQDQNGSNIVSFFYNDLGTLDKVKLASGIEVSYKKNISGNTTNIKAVQITTGKVIYQEDLSYDEVNLADAFVPQTVVPRYDGKITSVLEKYTSDLDAVGATRFNSYFYDKLGKLTESKQHQHSGTAAYNSKEELIPAQLSWTENTAQNQEFSYDDNGRILNKTIKGQKATFFYQKNDVSYLLNKIQGVTLADRDFSTTNTFVYSPRGELVEDKSQSISIAYDWQSMAHTQERTLSATLRVKEFQLYDADGLRTSRILYTLATDTTLTESQHFVRDGFTNYKEVRERPNGSQTELSILGLSSKVGRVLADGSKEYFVKNHQGSTKRVVAEDGSFASKHAFAYQPYGEKSDLKVDASSSEMTELYTTKQWSSYFGSYYFGSRSFDPVLGVWLTPDPAGQFSNPFAFGGDPVNYVDPDGRFILEAIAIGFVVGAFSAAVNEGSGEDILMGGLLGAGSGAITGGFGSLGTTVGTNIFWSSVGAQANYLGTGWASPGGYSTSGYFGAAVGGAVSGLLPTYGGLNLKSGGALARNAYTSIGGEIAYGAVRGAITSSIGGGISAAIDGRNVSQSFVNGAKYGAVSGAIGSAVNIGLHGYIYNTGYEDVLSKEFGNFDSWYNPGFRDDVFSVAGLRHRWEGSELKHSYGSADQVRGEVRINRHKNAITDKYFPENGTLNTLAHEYSHINDVYEQGAFRTTSSYMSWDGKYSSNPQERRAFKIGKQVYENNH